MPTEDELVLAIKYCPPGETGGLLAEYHELVDARLGGMSALLFACYLGRSDVAAAIAGYRHKLDVFEATSLGDVTKLRAVLDGSPAAVGAVSSDGFYPLGLACYFRRPECVALLIERGADITLPAENSTRATPLHSAVTAGGVVIAGFLVNRGAPVDARQQGGFTPLMSAAVSGNRQITELLLAGGADASLTDDGGLTATDHATQAGHTELAELLAAQPQPKASVAGQ